MKAICITKLAPKGGLRGAFEIKEFPVPEPASGQVRVRVGFTAVNIDDVRIAEGRFPVPGQAVKPTVDHPYIPGHDFAGVVDAVGPGVTRLKVGDRVYGQARSCWSEYCLSDAAKTGVIPERWSPQRAVASAMGSVVAKAAIDKLGDFSGKTGVIIGASGGIGNIALQYLAQHNATIWAVCSGRNEKAVKALGAKEVFDYTKAPFDEQISTRDSRVDFVLDFVGGKQTERAAYRVLGRGGQFVTAVGPLNFSEDVDVGAWGMIKVAAYLGLRTLTPSFIRPSYSFATMPLKPDFSSAPLGEDFEALIDGQHEFDQNGVAEAIDRVMSHRAAGKVLLAIPGF